MRSCGTCTLCCRVLEVKEISKPKDQWCQHCKPDKGCEIYETRPKECQDFSCLWLGAPEPWHTALEGMKPNRVKFVLAWHDANQVLQVHADPGYPDKWKAFGKFFLSVGEQLTVAVFTLKGVLGVGKFAQDRWKKEFDKVDKLS